MWITIEPVDKPVENLWKTTSDFEVRGFFRTLLGSVGGQIPALWATLQIDLSKP